MSWTDCHRDTVERITVYQPSLPPGELHNSALISPRYRYLFLNNPKVGCTTIRHHATGAGQVLTDYYSEELRRRVYAIYRRDFEYFDYPEALPAGR